MTLIFLFLSDLEGFFQQSEPVYVVGAISISENGVRGNGFSKMY